MWFRRLAVAFAGHCCFAAILIFASVGAMAEETTPPAEPATPAQNDGGTTAPAGKHGNKRASGPDTFLEQSPPLQFTLEHKADLNLTSDQEKQISDLLAKVKTAEDKLTLDEEFQAAYKTFAAARKNKDQAAAKTARQQLLGLAQAKTGVNPKELMSQLGQILTKDQMAKLKELHPTGFGGGKGQGKNNQNPPPPAGGPPQFGN